MASSSENEKPEVLEQQEGERATVVGERVREEREVVSEADADDLNEGDVPLGRQWSPVSIFYFIPNPKIP